MHLNYFSIPINFERNMFDARQNLKNTDLVTKCLLFSPATTFPIFQGEK